ncbi:uncharacterized protein LOC143589286 [Bidens hawaiensis]|uniref:uncharacterized protein LOC143589286 n=1 Tax=Bidens hawaiensis TaxID=980011 RepID=UPI00404AB152
MATSSTSSTYYFNRGSHEYPYPSHVNAASFLSVKLSGKPNYIQWQEQMTCLLDSYDMLGFIDGTIKKPQENNGSKAKADVSTFEAMYREWKRSDTLVKGWIYGSLSEDVMGTVVGLQTANDVWNKLKENYTTPSAPAPVTVGPPNTSTKKKDVGEYVPLCRAIQMGDWEKAQEFFNEDQDALIDKLNIDGQRSLHVAIGNSENIWFLQNLLERINPDSLPSLVNNKQQNALHYAAMLDNTIAVIVLVEKNPRLLFCVDYQNYLPIQKAIFNSHETTFLYLLMVCKQHIWLNKEVGNHNPFEGEKGVSLLNNAILSGFYDAASYLLHDKPELARSKVTTFKAPLWCIAKKWDAYRSAEQYNFYQRFVYYLLPTENYNTDNTDKIQDTENQEETNQVNMSQNSSFVYPVFMVLNLVSCVVMERIYVKFWKVALLYVPHIKHLYEDKVKHGTALTILMFICDEIGKLKSDHDRHYGDAFIEAVKNDTPEVIEQIIRFFPQSIWTRNNGYSLSQLSVMNRCEKVFNFFVQEVTHEKYLHNVCVDKDENNLLHLAGKLAPTHKLNMVNGAALQMQRELQWFQEVSKLVRPKDREAKNKKQETPIEVFRKEHKDLRQKGEEWMKKTADSYTITAALIITIVFAGAITVPGGNNGETGKAILESKPSFIVFAVSDAISLFTSTTSLLLFLSILTARCAEDDFLYKLPKRLILGLAMLFMSVTTMMIAFSAALYIMFGQENSWILIAIASITCLPIASFVTLQLPLLIDLISSTYSRGIFCKQNEFRITS